MFLHKLSKSLYIRNALYFSLKFYRKSTSVILGFGSKKTNKSMLIKKNWRSVNSKDKKKKEDHKH